MIIRARDLKDVMWKNGGGVTTEVFRSPPASEVYDYRFSFARVSSAGPFSEFSGYDRALVIWSGEGLRLNGKNLLPFDVFNFSGETPVHAELLEGEVLDFGCIYRRDRVKCRMVVTRTVGHDSGFYFVVQGRLKTPEGDVGPRDTYLAEGNSDCEVSGDFLAIYTALQRIE